MLKINQAISQIIRQSGIKARPNANPGIWLMFLLPLCLILSCIKHFQETSQLFRMCSALSAGLIGTSVIFIIQCARRQPLTIVRTLHLIPASLTATLFRFCLQAGFFFSLLSGIVSSVVYWRLLLIMFRKFPLSFTVGEISLAVQALTLFLYGTAVNLYFASAQTPTKIMHISTLILQVSLCTLGVLCLLVHQFKGLRRTAMFYTMTIFVVFFLLIIPLHILLQQSPLLWIFYFLFEDVDRTKLVAYWVACTVGAVVAVQKQIKRTEKASSNVRKVFHILAVAVFLPGLLYQCSLLYIASGVALGLFIALEMLRVLNVPPLGSFLQDGFASYRDEKDIGAVALTPMYLLVGCSLPLWIHPSPCDILDSAGFNLLPVMSGVLATGIGDTAASVVGNAIGKHQWHGTKKTVEGTIGCILSQLAVVFVLIYFGYIGTHQHEILKATVAIIVGSLVEAKTTQIDNIALPPLLFILLC